MRQITTTIISAFLSRQPKKADNSHTDGTSLFLHKNKIAEHRSDGLYITSAGWHTSTTKERLNALPGVRIHQKNFVWFLGGKEWDGSWIKVS